MAKKKSKGGKRGAKPVTEATPPDSPSMSQESNTVDPENPSTQPPTVPPSPALSATHNPSDPAVLEELSAANAQESTADPGEEGQSAEPASADPAQLEDAPASEEITGPLDSTTDAAAEAKESSAPQPTEEAQEDEFKEAEEDFKEAEEQHRPESAEGESKSEETAEPEQQETATPEVEPATEAQPAEKPEEAPAAETEPPADSAVDEKPPVEDAPFEAAPVEGGPSEETPAGEVSAEKAAVEAAPAEEAPADTTPAEKTTAEVPPVEETATKEASATEPEAPVADAPVEEASAEVVHIKEPSAETPPAEEPAAEPTPVEEAPVEQPIREATPTSKEPAETTPVEEPAPIEAAPVEEPSTERAHTEADATPTQAPTVPSVGAQSRSRAPSRAETEKGTAFESALTSPAAPPRAPATMADSSLPAAPSPPVGAPAESIKKGARTPSVFSRSPMSVAQMPNLPNLPSLPPFHSSRPQSPGIFQPPPPADFHSPPPISGYPHRGYGVPPPPASYAGYNGYPPGPPYMSPHYQPQYPGYPPQYAAYPSPSVTGSRQLSMGSSDFSGLLQKNGGMEAEDDPGDLLSRVSSAIPDLHNLLSKYNQTRSEISVREELLRKAEAQQQEMLKRKEDYIDNLTKQLETSKDKYSSETNKLRLEIGNLEDKQKELQERITEAETSRKNMEEVKASLEAQTVELEKEKVELEKNTAEEKERLVRDFDEWKVKANEGFEAEKVALATEFDRQLKEHQDAFDGQKAQQSEEFIKEKESMRSNFQRQKRDMEANFESIRKELEAKLSSSQKDLEEALRKERESRELWSNERENLIKNWEEERESLNNGYEEQRDLLTSQHKKEKEDLERTYALLHADLTKKAETEREALLKENDMLRRGWEEDKGHLERMVKEMRDVADNLGSEKARLQKMVECFGETTDLKSKGDAYYTDAFGQLCKQILDLSTTHFTHLPVTPPTDILDRIPSSLPSFLGDTPSARQLRSAYIAHTVSNILTFRVFTPFLFSLGRRYDKADGLFSSMSNQLRGKSTRREAIWRQHTLVAAFTSAGAKQRINAAAGAVVDEIVSIIRHFADPTEEEAIRVAVRRIVKLAAETWRFARLEREMITAKLPPADEEDAEGRAKGFWPAYNFDPDSISGETPTPGAKVLLRLFPVIEREEIHESFQITEKEIGDKGCVYSSGLALYNDVPALKARRGEIRVNGGSTAEQEADFAAADIDAPVMPIPQSSVSEMVQKFEEVANSASNSPTQAHMTKRDSLSSERRPSSSSRTRSTSRTSPPSPLFAATDEIDSQKSVRISRRRSSARKSVHRSESVARSTSGHTLNSRSSRESRFGTDHRSAALKGLYAPALRQGGVKMERRDSGTGKLDIDVSV